MCLVYIDDIVVVETAFKQHLRNLGGVFASSFERCGFET